MSSFPKLARYQVLGRLATGGMAQVWLGRALGFGGFEKLVVLKTILPNLVTNPQFVQMFINEARVAAMLSHPNCVQIFELGKEEDILYIAMEYIEGFSLSRVLKRARARAVKMPLNVHARIMCDALSGLEYAHRLTDREGRAVGLIHRDVSPDNLLISFSGQTKLVDFGIAKASLSAAQATRAGTVKGKLGYIAPEYLRGQPIDARADLFALGVVMYRALTGKRPFAGSTEAAVSLAVLRDEPVWPTEVETSLPQAMSALVMMALEKNPEARFPSAKVMRQALESAVRPADPDELAVWLTRLWPPGDPERVALEALASGKAEETSEPLLESIISTGFEVPHAAARATGPFASPLVAEPGSEASAPTAAAQLVLPGLSSVQTEDTPLAPMPVASPAVVQEPGEDSALTRTRKGSLKWAALGLSIAAGGAAVWKLRPARPAAAAAMGVPGAAAAGGQRALVGSDGLPSAPGSGLGGATAAGESDAAQAKATLSVRVEPWAYVKIDGKMLGQTPVRRELAEGSHTVELWNTELNVTKKLDVVLKAGESRSLVFNFEQ